MDTITSTDTETLREAALRSLKKRRDFRTHLMTYVLVNAALVAVWAITMPGGFFWPVFPLVFWGIGVALNAWDAYVAGDITEEQIEREVQRLQHRR
ncbi:2TM domain-containing protein [Nocardioides bigeumensis]|uniref:2TM domain-containing protein n=1 Tax=Nocardioides bigeumensis TaxID=433657 RepID=A0ABP5JRL1_9ACTN